MKMQGMDANKDPYHTNRAEQIYFSLKGSMSTGDYYNFFSIYISDSKRQKAATIKLHSKKKNVDKVTSVKATVQNMKTKHLATYKRLLAELNLEKKRKRGKTLLKNHGV